MRKPSSASGAGAQSARLAAGSPVSEVDRSHSVTSGAARQGTKLEFQATSSQPSLRIIDLLREVVFTLPDYLSALALGNRRQIYNLLFQAAWQALDVTLRQTGKFHLAALMVLHT